MTRQYKNTSQTPTKVLFLKRIFFDNGLPQRFMHPIKSKFWKIKRHFPLKSKTPYSPPSPIAPYLFAMTFNC